jgi:hypothetical protein
MKLAKEPTMTANRVIVRQGIAAREARKSRDDNPFATNATALGHKAFIAWQAGWDEADARLTPPALDGE